MGFSQDGFLREHRFHPRETWRESLMWPVSPRLHASLHQNHWRYALYQERRAVLMDEARRELAGLLEVQVSDAGLQAIG